MWLSYWYHISNSPVEVDKERVLFSVRVHYPGHQSKVMAQSVD